MRKRIGRPPITPRIPLTKKFLTRVYTQEKRGLHEIAKLAVCSTPTVRKMIEKYRIKIHPTGMPGKSRGQRFYFDKETLERTYNKYGQSISTIAMAMGCKGHTVWRALHRFGIPIRPKRRGPEASRWKGGRHKNGKYINVWRPDHPNNVKGYVREHILVMEKKLGRYLRGKEVVHHINCDGHDNRVENLKLFASNKEHIKEHFKDHHSPSKRMIADCAWLSLVFLR